MGYAVTPNRTAPTSSPAVSAHGAFPSTEKGSAALTEDELDLRRFSQLTPIEQLDQLEAGALALNRHEREMRAAEAQLNATKEDAR